MYESAGQIRRWVTLAYFRAKVTSYLVALA